jgi:hypothetical protein
VSNVTFHPSKAFTDSLATHARKPGVLDALKRFKDHKTKTPLEPFGAKDYHLGKEGNFKEVPGLRHAGLTHDVSVFYTLSGGPSNRQVRLYGVHSHDEIGIGQPPNMKKQKSTAKRMSNQDFE